MEPLVGVIGIWHLGSVISSCLADEGYNVIGFDDNRERVKELNTGNPPIYEPGLQEIITRNIEEGRLKYSYEYNLITDCSCVFLALDTKVNDNDDIDIDEIFHVIQNIGIYLTNNVLIIICSQVPVGTCNEIISLIQEIDSSLVFSVAYVPENLQLGNAISRFKYPDGIVIGVQNEESYNRTKSLFYFVDCPKLQMNLVSAEMTKHAINAFLATSISFANELGNLCDKIDGNAIQVANGMALDKRIGSGLPLKPGLAFSGGTLARDLRILQKLGQSKKYKTNLIDGTLRVNEFQKQLIITKLLAVFSSLNGKTIGILGLTYKAGTSTLRRSASIDLIKQLINFGVSIRAHDPQATRSELDQYNNFIFFEDKYMMIKNLDALIIMTDWPEYYDLDFLRIKRDMNNLVIFDAKNMFEPENIIQLGYTYLGIGTGDHSGTEK